MTVSDDETYTIPIKDQRYFGAGLKRKRVPFVPASSPTTPPSGTPGSAVSEQYLSIIGGGSSSRKLSESRWVDGSDGVQGEARRGQTTTTMPDSTSPSPTIAPVERCGVCKLPIAQGHERSLAHQVCLEHSHPPSAIDRGRRGLALLRAHGWDPDSRQGLGKDGEGILHPIKLREKNDTVGLGMRVPKHGVSKAKTRNLDAKEVRKDEEQSKRRKEQLQRLFYYNEDVLRYLGEG